MTEGTGEPGVPGWLSNKRTRILALLVYGGLLAVSVPPWPDDWDGVGFVESVRSFDIAHFQPHPPGYPVYVAVLRVASWLALGPIAACSVIAVLSGLATAAFTFAAVRARIGEVAAWKSASLVVLAPLAWRACSGVGTEGPALACLAACAWALLAVRGGVAFLVLGIAAGLGLGVRLSWAPLYLAALLLAPRGTRWRATLLAGAVCAAWAIPLALIVGPSKLYGLTAGHFAGHAERWGGTALTEPGPIRIAWLLRDVFVDGFGCGGDPLGIAIGILAFACGAFAFAAWRRAAWIGWKSGLLAVAPYTMWIAVGQNLRDQPRHALPLVAILAAGIPVARLASRLSLGCFLALLSAVAIRSSVDAFARRTIPPPGEQLVELARSQPSPDRLDIFGVSSVRFFELGELRDNAFAAGAVGDVEVRLSRVNTLPSRVWITSEVTGRDTSPWPLTPIATLCRPRRIDRRAPCLEVYDWQLPYLRRSAQGAWKGPSSAAPLR